MAIVPVPIIDNTVSACMVDEYGRGDLDIVYYFSGDITNVKTDTIFVRMTDQGGNSLLNNDEAGMWLNANAANFETLKVKDETVTDKFKVSVPHTALNRKYFSVNSQIRVALKAESIDGQAESEFSQSKSFYMIAPITTTVYGGVSAEEALYLRDKPKSSILNEEEVTTIDFSAVNETFRFNAYCEMVPVNGVVDNDVLAWFQAKIYKQEENNSVVTYTEKADSEQQFIDRYKDETRLSFTYSFNSLALDKDNIYKLIVLFSTNKGYRFTKSYDFEVKEKETSLNSLLKINSVTVTPEKKKGVLKIASTLAFIDGSSTENLLISGVWEFSRAKISNSDDWQMVAKKNWVASQVGETTYEFEDTTVESGVQYKYRIAFYSYSYGQKKYAQGSNEKTQWYTTNSYSCVYFEDIFLDTKDTKLKVRFNPKVSSFKRNYIDVFSPTLGGAYPFARRNGQQKYHTFNIGGLLSIYGDDQLFVRANEIVELQNQQASLSDDEREVFLEKVFRDKVMNYLYSDQVILYRSATEGNMFIRLSNISFTPEDKLGRRIWSFTALATEVESLSKESYLKYFGDLEPKTNYIVGRFLHYLPIDSKGETLTYDGNGNLYARESDIGEDSSGGSNIRDAGVLLGSPNQAVDTMLSDQNYQLWGSWAEDTNLYYGFSSSSDKVIITEDDMTNCTHKLVFVEFEF